MPPPPRAAMEIQRSYYQVLDVAFEAPEEEIRRQYYSVVRTLHPDRQRPGGMGSEALTRFHEVQSAWRCLSDPTRRLLYDLRNFGRSSLGAAHGNDIVGKEAEARLLALQKEQAERDVANMQVQLEKVLRREQGAKGILVRRALYGDLRLREDCLEEGLAGTRTIQPEDLVGPVVDVSASLQCLVEQHTIVIPGGASASKADLPGFYNPAPLNVEAELALYVLYDFRGLPHEVLVSDRETLSLPYRRHAVPAGKAPRGPFSPANVARVLGQQARRGAGRAGAPPPAAAASGAPPPPAGTAAPRRLRPAEALQRAVDAYQLCKLRDARNDPTEVSRKEFAAVASVAAAAVALAALWASSASASAGGPAAHLLLLPGRPPAPSQ